MRSWSVSCVIDDDKLAYTFSLIEKRLYAVVSDIQPHIRIRTNALHIVAPVNAQLWFGSPDQSNLSHPLIMGIFLK